MTTGVKVALGVGAVAVVGGGIYFLRRRTALERVQADAPPRSVGLPQSGVAAMPTPSARVTAKKAAGNFLSSALATAKAAVSKATQDALARSLANMYGR